MLSFSDTDHDDDITAITNLVKDSQDSLFSNGCNFTIPHNFFCTECDNDISAIISERLNLISDGSNGYTSQFVLKDKYIVAIIKEK